MREKDIFNLRFFFSSVPYDRLFLDLLMLIIEMSGYDMYNYIQPFAASSF